MDFFIGLKLWVLNDIYKVIGIYVEKARYVIILIAINVLGFKELKYYICVMLLETILS